MPTPALNFNHWFFDLIQIWGGLTGGSIFYNSNNRLHNCLRLNYHEWIDDYRKLIMLSINDDKMLTD